LKSNNRRKAVIVTLETFEFFEENNIKHVSNSLLTNNSSSKTIPIKKGIWTVRKGRKKTETLKFPAHKFITIEVFASLSLPPQK
jgi:hypothetical protein